MLILACDHGGFELKEQIKGYLASKNFQFFDVGAGSLKPMDGFSDYIENFIKKMREDKDNRGIIMCGTGIAMSIGANRAKGIRAALCHRTEYAQLAREHNNANVLCLGGRFISFDDAKKIIDVFLNTKFLGGKYKKRMDICDTIN